MIYDWFYIWEDIWRVWLSEFLGGMVISFLLAVRSFFFSVSVWRWWNKGEKYTIS